MRNSFTLRGTIKDDTAVESVVVAFVNREGKATSVFADVDNKKGTWQAVLNRKDSTGFPLKDGKQLFTIRAKDNSGKEDTTDAVLIIDNTAPFLVLDRPSSVEGGIADVFGSKFVLVGQVADVNDAEKLKITATSADGTITKAKTLYHIPPTVDITVDSFWSEDKDGFYRGLYGNEEAAGKKEYTYTLEVSDGAKEYDSPDSNGNAEEGNKTDVYYRYDDVYKAVLKEYKVNDIYAMLNGSYAGDAKVKDILEFLQNSDHKMGGSGDGKGKAGMFALNAAKDPKFSIDGFRPEMQADNFKAVYAGTVLNVKMVRNLDKTPFHTDISQYQVTVKEFGSSEQPKPVPTTFSREDGSLTASITVDTTMGQDVSLSYGKTYIVGVKGADVDGNSFIADNSKGSGHYGFTLRKLGRVPEITALEIKEGTVIRASDPNNISERVFIKDGEVTLKLKVAQADLAQDNVKLFYRLYGPDNTVLLTKDNEAVTANEPQITLAKTRFTSDGAYKLELWVETLTGSSMKQTYHIYRDTTGPQITISSPFDGVKLNEDSKKITISGTLFDAGIGLDSASLVVKLLKPDGTEETFTPSSSNPLQVSGSAWKINEIAIDNDDSSLLHVEGEYSVTVTAQDKLGQGTSKTYKFVYDRLPPQIVGLKIDDHGVTDGTTAVNKTGTVKVTGEVKETHGINSFTINGSNAGTSAGPFNKELTLAEGRHPIEIKVKDKADKEVSQKLTVVVDKTVPQFEAMKIGGQSVAAEGQSISTTSSTVAINGKIKETGSGVKELLCQLEGESEWKPLNVVKKADGYHFDGFVEINLGSQKKISLKVTDEADFEATWDCTVTVTSTTAVLTLKVEDQPVPFVNATNGAYHRKLPAQIQIHGYSSSATGTESVGVTVKKADGASISLSNFFDPTDEPKVTALKLTNDTAAPVQSFKTKNDLADGQYKIEVTGGGADPKTVILIIDKTGPGITPVSPQQGGIIAAGSEVHAAISDVSGIKEAKAYYQKEGGLPTDINLLITPYKGTLPSPLAEGKYEVWFTAKDMLDNETVGTKMTVWNDSGNPTLTEIKVDGKEESTVYSKAGTVTVTGKAEDANGIEKVCILEGGAVKKETTSIHTANHTWTLNFTGGELEEGTHNLTIRVQDKVGKIAEVQKTVIVDAGAPALSVTKINNTVITGNNFTAFSNGYVAEGGLFIEGTAADMSGSGVDNVSYIFNDGTSNIDTARSLALTSGAFKQTIQVPAAAKKLILTCVDKAGNSTEQTITVKVDSKQPKQPEITDVGGKGKTAAITVSGKESSIVIKGTVSDDTTGGADTFSGIKEITWKLDTASGDGVLNTGVNPNEWTITIPQANIKAGSVIITATDMVGYTSVPAAIVFLQDTEAPTAKITNFDEFTAQTGEITVKGSIADRGTAGVLPNKTQWKIVKKTETAPTVDNPGGNWMNVDSSTVANWEITSLNLARYFEGSGSYTSDYATAHNPADGLWTLPLYLRVEDASENKAVIPLTILVDPAGDAPVVNIIAPLSPKNSTTPLSVGGKIAVYGTASVKVGSIGEVYMDVSKDENFSSFVGSWNNKKIDGMGSWNTLLNENKELEALLTGSQKTIDIYYRVRAKNGTGSNKMGGYSAVQKLRFDKGAPVIQDAKLHKNGNASGTMYSEREWIKGLTDYLTLSISDDSGIKSIKITTAVNGEVKDTQTLDGKAAITAYEIISGQKVFIPVASTDPTSYNAKIPLKTADLSEKGGEYTISITVTEGTKTGTDFLTQTVAYTFRFDKEKPIGQIGEQVDAGNSVFSGTTLPSILSTAEVGQHLYVNKKKVDIVLSGTTKQLSEAVTGTFDWVLYKDRDYFATSSAVVKGIAYDEGTSEVAKITGKITKNDGTVLSETDFTVDKGSFKKPIGGFITWEKAITIPTGEADGEYKLVYTVEDGNGNKSDELTQTIYIKRKGIHITKISLGTDLNRNNSVDSGSDEVVAFSEKDSRQDDRTFDWSGEVDASSFVFKRTTGKTSTDKIGTIKAEYTGGNGAVTYTLKKDGTVVKTGTLTDNTIQLTQTEFANIGTGSVILDLELKDTCGWKSFEKIKVNVGITDTVKPFGAVLPLFWNDTGAKKNSIAWTDSTPEGHISYEGYNTTPGGASATYTGKPAVSGKIIVSGYAYDETLLKKITITAGTVDVVSTFKNNASNEWDDGAATGLTLKITTQKLNQGGHYAFWELTWDTATIANGVGSNITVSVKAEDTAAAQANENKIKTISGADTTGGTSPNRRGGSATDLTIASLANADADAVRVGQTVRLYASDPKDPDAYYVYIKSKEEVKVDENNKKLILGLSESVDTTITQYCIYTNTATADPSSADNKSITVDVVPYVTKLGTFISGSAGDEFARSAKGDYSVRSDEVVKLYGFNLPASESDIVAKAGAVPLTVGAKTNDDEGKSYYPITIVSTATSTAVDITVKVGSSEFPAINNRNQNPTFNANGNITKYGYNSMANVANKYLTDDIKLAIWEVSNFHKSVKNDITSPMLKIDSASNWYMSYGEGVPEMIVNKNGTKTRIDYSYNKFHNTAVAYDGSKNIYALATNTDRVDNNSAKFSFYSREVEISKAATNYQLGWKGKARLEKVYNQEIYNINRVQRPKMVVSGNTTETKVYMVYFDSNHADNPVKFRYGTVGSDNTFSEGIEDGGQGNNANDAMNGLSNGSALGFHTVADKQSDYKGGEYAAVGVTSNGTAVVAWYDASKKCLVYSYNDAPQTVQANASADDNKWQKNAKVIDANYAGWYVDLAVDEKDGIHIAYYNSAKGDLKYAYLPSYNDTPTVVTVDSYLSVGTQISISTRNEGTSENPKIVPYISYFQSAFTQTPSSVRVAWRNDLTGIVKDGAKDDLFTGAWEVMTIPTTDIPKDETICNGVPTSGNWAGTVVLGFMSDNGYKKAVLRK